MSITNTDSLDVWQKCSLSNECFCLSHSDHTHFLFVQRITIGDEAITYLIFFQMNYFRSFHMFNMYEENF